jgi:hypothetical protein
MPTPRTVCLLQCVGSPGGTDDGTWWLAETYLTSDGPRMRLLPVPGGRHATEDQARAEMDRLNALLTPPPMVTVEECRRANRENYDRGRRDGEADGLSRARNRPGDGDMGG